MTKANAADNVLVFNTIRGASKTGSLMLVLGAILFIAGCGFVFSNTVVGVALIGVGGFLLFKNLSKSALLRRAETRIEITPEHLIIDGRQYERAMLERPETREAPLSEHQRRTNPQQEPIYEIVFPYGDDLLTIPGMFEKQALEDAHRRIVRRLERIQPVAPQYEEPEDAEAGGPAPRARRGRL